MKACSLTATDEDGDEVHLMFILSVTADPMPTFAQSGIPIKAMDETTYTLTATDDNGDGNANFADFLTFASKFGSRLGQERYDAQCDLNGDGEIGFSDFLIFAADFGSTG